VGDIQNGYGNPDYAHIKDTEIAALAGGISKVIGSSFKTGFTKTFKDVTEYRQALKMVEQVNYTIFKVAFKEKLLEKGIENERLGELTSKQLTEVLGELMEEGVYYSSKNAVEGKGQQDFFKTDVLAGTEGNFIKVKLSPSQFQSGTGFYATINQVVKDLKANVGSIGVINIHNVDGTVMVEGHINDVLNVYDALVMGTKTDENTESVQAMNQSFYDISMRHSILGNSVEKLVRNGSKYMKAVRESGLGNELFQDIKRIFEISKQDSDVLTEEKFVTKVMETLEKTDTNRRVLAKEKLKVNQYYVTDDVKAIEGATDESTLERHAIFSNDKDLVDTEKSIIEQMLKTLVKVANEGVPKEETQDTTTTTTTTKSNSAKSNKGTITKEQIPEELNKLMGSVTDQRVKTYMKKWLDRNLNKMENC
jgi:hypothetical protein